MADIMEIGKAGLAFLFPSMILFVFGITLGFIGEWRNSRAWWEVGLVFFAAGILLFAVCATPLLLAFLLMWAFTFFVR